MATSLLGQMLLPADRCLGHFLNPDPGSGLHLSPIDCGELEGYIYASQSASVNFGYTKLTY
jgi:hypothetical protein